MIFIGTAPNQPIFLMVEHIGDQWFMHGAPDRPTLNNLSLRLFGDQTHLGLTHPHEIVEQLGIFKCQTFQFWSTALPAVN